MCNALDWLHRFRLASSRSYIVTLIPTLNKFHKQTNKQAEIGKKIKQKLSNNLRLILENYPLSSSMLSSKTNLRYSKKCAKNKCISFNEVVLLIIMKTRVKMKNRSHSYELGHDMVMNILNIKCFSVRRWSKNLLNNN